MEKAELATKLKKLSDQVEQFQDKLSTEEATKNALIMPFFAALNYNVFDPTEFVPEYTADFGSKKGERVDYAIILNDEVQILIETKELSDDLQKKDSQLFRYFTATKAKFGILTNGDIYKFYTDLDNPNVMDKAPFLTIKMSDLKDSQITELFKFAKDNFDVDSIASSAASLKNVGLARNYLSEQIEQPSEEFVRLVLSNIYDGIKTQTVIDEFTPVISKAFNQIISEQINSKLSNALNQTVAESTTSNENDNVETKSDDKDNGIVTTPEELESYAVAKVVMKDIIEPDRIVYRDNHSYFNVLIDDSNRKWVLRIYFKANRNFIVLHDDSTTELEFDNPVDIANFADQINKIAEEYK